MRIRRWIVSAVLAACVVAVASPTSSVAFAPAPLVSAPDSLPAPSPDLAPQEVVRIQVDALRSNDQPFPNAGIEVAYRFSSPENKAVTGPIESFTRLVESPRYRPMLEAVRVTFSEVQREGDVARQGVLLVTGSGERVGYLFELTKQPNGCGCWMTDAVLPVSVPDGNAREI